MIAKTVQFLKTTSFNNGCSSGRFEQGQVIILKFRSEAEITSFMKLGVLTDVPGSRSFFQPAVTPRVKMTPTPVQPRSVAVPIPPVRPHVNPADIVIIPPATDPVVITSVSPKTVCDDCGVECAAVKNADGGVEYICPICQKNYSAVLVPVAAAPVDEAIDSLTCKVCGRAFTSTKGLTMHVQRAHK